MDMYVEIQRAKQRLADRAAAAHGAAGPGTRELSADTATTARQRS